MLVGAVPGDAIFNQAQLLRKWLREWGYASDIYAAGINPELPHGEAYSYTKYQVRDAYDSLLIFHYSIGSDLTPFVRQLPVPILLVYHNVTPSEFFRGVHQQLFEKTLSGRRDLIQFSEVPLAVANSEFSRSELEELGFANTGILPLPVDVQRYSVAADAMVMSRFDDQKTNLLFVGRVAPNKRQEDIIRAYYYYKKINPDSRLLLVGSWSACSRYKSWLEGYAKFLGLSDVHFCGHVSTEELVAYYSLADVFVCMSEHEGFCVPLAESMHFDLPIVAYESTGIPFTLGDAGLLLKRKDFPVIAELIHVLVTDGTFRSRIIAHQRDQLENFRPEIIKSIFRAHLDRFVGSHTLA